MSGVAVLVVQVVGMLPDVKGKDGGAFGGHGVAGAGFLGDGQCAIRGVDNNKESAYRPTIQKFWKIISEKNGRFQSIKRQFNYTSLKPEGMRKDHHYNKGNA